MLDDFHEWQYQFRLRLYRRVPIDFIDPRWSLIRTKDGRQAKTSFDNLYEGDRNWSWICFVDFLRNCARVRQPDGLLRHWARWYVDYGSVPYVSEEVEESVRELLASPDGPRGGMASPEMAAWFDFAGYLLYRTARG